MSCRPTCSSPAPAPDFNIAAHRVRCTVYGRIGWATSRGVIAGVRRREGGALVTFAKAEDRDRVNNRPVRIEGDQDRPVPRREVRCEGGRRGSRPPPLPGTAFALGSLCSRSSGSVRRSATCRRLAVPPAVLEPAFVPPAVRQIQRFTRHRRSPCRSARHCATCPQRASRRAAFRRLSRAADRCSTRPRSASRPAMS